MQMLQFAIEAFTTFRMRHRMLSRWYLKVTVL